MAFSSQRENHKDCPVHQNSQESNNNSGKGSSFHCFQSSSSETLGKYSCFFSYRRIPLMHLWSSTLLAILDLKTKNHMAITIPEGTTYTVNSYLSLVHWWNTGISWSLFSHKDNLWVLLTLSGFLCCCLVFFLIKSPSPLLRWALTLMLGGAMGNIVDRYHHGAVFDFLYVHYNTWGFPAFNLADVFLTLGWILCFWHYIFLKKNHYSSCEKREKNIK